MAADQILEELIKLSLDVGREDRALAILGEGNTSADVGDGTFWIKASGTSFSTANAASFSHIRMDAVLEYVERPHMSEVEVGEALADVLVDPTHKRPSTETFMHAVLLAEGGAKWVAHAHPVSANSILCSKLGAEPYHAPDVPRRHRRLRAPPGRRSVCGSRLLPGPRHPQRAAPLPGRATAATPSCC